MKTLVASTIVALGLLSAGAASADQYVGNACVKKNGAVRFVDRLKANRQKCKAKEQAANYRKVGKILDGNGQFLGYGDLSNNPY